MTVEGIVAAIVFITPGAAYLWALEGQVGNWETDGADRTIRFLAFAVIFHIAAGPITYMAWDEWVRSGDLTTGAVSPWTLWVLLLYLAIPVGFGWITGRSILKRHRWTQFVVGRNPAPRAWDHVFYRDLVAWVRAKLNDGTWIGGLYAADETEGRASYAAGYGAEPDLFLAWTQEVDPKDGMFVEGAPLQPVGVLLKLSDIQQLYIEPAEENPTTNEEHSK